MCFGQTVSISDRDRAPWSLLGRSQVVRQRFLVPPFPGSNPGAPANHFNGLEDFQGQWHWSVQTFRLRVFLSGRVARGPSSVSVRFERESAACPRQVFGARSGGESSAPLSIPPPSASAKLPECLFERCLMAQAYRGARISEGRIPIDWYSRSLDPRPRRHSCSRCSPRQSQATEALLCVP